MPTSGLALTFPHSNPPPGPQLLAPRLLLPVSPPHSGCPHSPWSIGSLGLCLDGGAGASEERLGASAHAVVVVTVEGSTVARGWQGPMAPWGEAPTGRVQVVDPAGSRYCWLPMGVGAGTGWSRDVWEAAAGVGVQFSCSRDSRTLREAAAPYPRDLCSCCRCGQCRSVGS